MVYWGGFLLAGHYALIAYINSSLLGQFIGNNALDVLYIIGSILSITFLFLAPFSCANTAASRLFFSLLLWKCWLFSVWEWPVRKLWLSLYSSFIFQLIPYYFFALI